MMGYQIQLLDAVGNTASNVEVGEELLLEVSVADLRTNPQGVFSAFLDVEFFGSNVELDIEGIEFGSNFDMYTNAAILNGGTLTVGPGQGPPGTIGIGYSRIWPTVIDDTGGLGIGPADNEYRKLFSIPMVATEPGDVTFYGNPSDDIVYRPSLLMGMHRELRRSEIQYENATLMVVPEPDAASCISVLGLVLAIHLRKPRIEPKRT